MIDFFHRSPCYLVRDLLQRLIGTSFVGITVLLSGAVVRFAIDILPVGRKIVLHAFWELFIGLVGHGISKVSFW